MTETTNQQWLLAARPEGRIKESDFRWNEAPVPEPGEGELLIRTLYISLDPTNRGWMGERATYLPPLPLGEVVRGIAIGVVEKSRHPDFAEGAVVQGMFGWQRYSLSNGKGLTLLPPIPGLPLTAYFGALGHIGMTAYFGLLEIGQPQAGETLTVTAAAGAVGSLAGQIGKIRGCRVVGIAGADEKCRWLTGELGFDAAINYKTENVLTSLRRHCPNGIDIIFENVGGKIFDAELALINLRARIVLCGLISQYNATEPQPGPYNLANILVRRARMEGFIITDYAKRAGEAVPQLAQWVLEGRLKYRVDVVDGLEQAPTAINRLFDGTNEGKLIVKVSEEG